MTAIESSKPCRQTVMGSIKYDATVLPTWFKPLKPLNELWRNSERVKKLLCRLAVMKNTIDKKQCKIYNNNCYENFIKNRIGSLIQKVVEIKILWQYELPSSNEK